MPAKMNSFYTKFSEYLQSEFGGKVWKISLDAGFSCPNNDETGREGCIFCRNDSISPNRSMPRQSISEQMQRGITSAQELKNISQYIAYFQSSTNTFAPVSTLRKLYREAVNFNGVVGISIATRPDCLPDDVVELLKELADEVTVWVELGLQSANDKTLQVIHRGHTFADYLSAVEKLSRINVRICTHVMLGLPGETHDDVLHTARQISQTPTHEVKIHPLLILKETKLEELNNSGQVDALQLGDYAKWVCDFLELLPPEMVIQRLTAEAPAELLIAPSWSSNKFAVLNAIENEFKKRGTRQGDKYQPLIGG
jgi:uncharacterized protein